MTKPKQPSETLGNEAEITLGLLNVIHENSSVTQRSAANELGVALGLVNTYLKRCIKKGLIKVQQAPANRYLYYLTPHGFAEKGKLTRDYLYYSFTFFRDARSQCAEMFAFAAENGWTRLALYGAGDLADIASLCALEHPVTLVAVIDPDAGEGPESGEANGIPIVRNLRAAREAAGAIDAVILTDLVNPQDGFDTLIREIPAELVLTPKILGISRKPPKLME